MHLTFIATLLSLLLWSVPASAEPSQPKIEVVQTGPGFSLATTGYIAAGLGLAIVGGGVWFGLEVQNGLDTVNDLDRRDPKASRARFQHAVDRVEQDAFFANLLYGVGGVALVGGLTMALLASDGPFGTQTIEIRMLPSGAAIGGRF